MTESMWRLLADIPVPGSDEITDVIASGARWRIERIVSHGHTAPATGWFEQSEDEWVMVLTGHARIQFDGEAQATELRAGDAVWIPAHRRHRVSWTDPDQLTVWLALFLESEN